MSYATNARLLLSASYTACLEPSAVVLIHLPNLKISIVGIAQENIRESETLIGREMTAY